MTIYRVSNGLSNYCNLSVIASHNITIDIRQNLYYTVTDKLNVSCKDDQKVETYCQ